MKIKQFLSISILMLFAHFLLAQTAAQTPIGKWKTFDDKTNKPKSIIEITKSPDGKLQAKVIKLFPEPGEDPDPICNECTDYRKDKKVIGMVIMTDLHWDEDDEDWQGGEILDPEIGKIYDCYIAIENANKLKVRGFIGFSLLGRTQYWERVN